jgi:hypothetical protein
MPLDHLQVVPDVGTAGKGRAISSQKKLVPREKEEVSEFDSGRKEISVKFEASTKAIRSCIFGGQREGIRKEGSALKVESVPGKYVL